MDKLKELNIHENTIVFFLSDNGGPYKTNGSINDPLREGKGSLYEGGIRVPFAMRWPAKIQGGQVYIQPIISLDIFATAATYAGAETKNTLDGVNIVPFLLGEKEGVPHEQLFWRQYDKKAYAVRSGDLKLVNIKGEQDELYNLNEDIGESNQLDAKLELQSLIEKKDEWTSKMMDPVFLGLMQNNEYNKIHPERFE